MKLSSPTVSAVADKEAQFSWELLDSGLDPAKGPVTKEFGFMHDPKPMTAAPTLLPSRWRELWLNLPHHYAHETVRSFCNEGLETLNVEEIRKQSGNGLAFMKTKSIVFCIAQAWVDSERVIAEEMDEPPPLPKTLQSAMDDFASLCECPDYCTLADMSLTASLLVTDKFDPKSCTFDDFVLISPVNNSERLEEIVANDRESARARANAENRFHNTPTMMEYRTHDLVQIVARTQQLVFQYESIDGTETEEQKVIIAELLGLLEAATQSFRRLQEGFGLLNKKTVDPVVWHRDIVKYTSGYGGHLGMSGPQAPCIHLIDAFLGRTSYKSELGDTTTKTFAQIQHNHREFIRSVAAGPSLREFAQTLENETPGHPLADAFNKLVDNFTNGFLALHKGRAIEFARQGFNEAGPREFTAETSYIWPATNNVTKKLKGFFDEARQERSMLKVVRSGADANKQTRSNRSHGPQKTVPLQCPFSKQLVAQPIKCPFHK
ncbi:expressed unknown protein [Seminavis robusta]|uniref:Uncharacterized protein n=1 Tax=Seminavis robusta TaxID=568900 RepID=A0A9N8DE48_9STRA|nr:expressed unknown protein [Seminavis robusta]|eukprot:Sro52_g030840.1 n/a (492) ;mRNA; r:15046-16521